MHVSNSSPLTSEAACQTCCTHVGVYERRGSISEEPSAEPQTQLAQLPNPFMEETIHLPHPHHVAPQNRSQSDTQAWRVQAVFGPRYGSCAFQKPQPPATIDTHTTQLCNNTTRHCQSRSTSKITPLTPLATEQISWTCCCRQHCCQAGNSRAVLRCASHMYVLTNPSARPLCTKPTL